MKYTRTTPGGIRLSANAQFPVFRYLLLHNTSCFPLQLSLQLSSPSLQVAHSLLRPSPKILPPKLSSSNQQKTRSSLTTIIFPTTCHSLIPQEKCHRQPTPSYMCCQKIKKVVNMYSQNNQNKGLHNYNYFYHNHFLIGP